MDETKRFSLKNITWYEDEFGPYCNAQLYNNSGNLLGATGSYYSVQENGMRADKETQIAELGRDYIILGDWHMEEVIAAIKAEIEAAEQKRKTVPAQWVSTDVQMQLDFGYSRYIDGLQTAVNLLEQRAQVEP